MDLGYGRNFFCTLRQACFFVCLPDNSQCPLSGILSRCLGQVCGQTCPSGGRRAAGGQQDSTTYQPHPLLPGDALPSLPLSCSTLLSPPPTYLSNSLPPTPPSLLRSTPLIPNPPAHLSKLYISSEAQRQHWKTSGKESFFLADIKLTFGWGYVHPFPLLPSCPGQSSLELNTSHPLTKLCASPMPISLYTAQPFSPQLISGSFKE